MVVAIYAAVPLAKLAADNRAFIAPGDLLRPYALVAAPLLALTLLVGLRRGGRPACNVAAPLALTILLVFDYRDLREPLMGLTNHVLVAALVVWTLLLVAIVTAGVRLGRRFDALPVWMLIAGALMVAPSLATYAHFQLGSARAVNALPGERALATRLAVRPAPDVFFFLLDAYGRPDRLKQRFHYDDSRLLTQLRGDGFVIPPKARSVYGITALSVPSILDADYVARAGTVRLPRMDPIMNGHNRVVGTFKRLGYSFALAPSEFDQWHCHGVEDICVRPSEAAAELGVSDVAWAAIERTPLADLLRQKLPSGPGGMLDKRQFPSRVVASVLARRHRGPVFTFAHVLLPHPPYVYHGPGCRFHPSAVNDGPLANRNYVEALQCTDADVAKAVKRLSDDDPDAIVVVASDHGSDVGANHRKPQWDWSPDLLRRRFSEFAALRLPRPCRRSVPANLVSVDIFRVVFNCIGSPKTPLLSAHRYLVDQLRGLVRPFGSSGY